MSRMLTLKQAAERLGIHLNTLRKYVDRGVIPKLKLDRLVRIEEKDLEEFIRSRKQGVKK